MLKATCYHLQLFCHDSEMFNRQCGWCKMLRVGKEKISRYLNGLTDVVIPGGPTMSWLVVFQKVVTARLVKVPLNFQAFLLTVLMLHPNKSAFRYYTSVPMSAFTLTEIKAQIISPHRFAFITFGTCCPGNLCRCHLKMSMSSKISAEAESMSKLC